MGWSVPAHCHTRYGIPLADNIDVESAIQQSLAQYRVVKAIEDLTKDQRQVILLEFIEVVGNTSAADDLSKSINAVKAR
jgi:DNA-directed RNA polymerase specialized sigma24 family protein